MTTTSTILVVDDDAGGRRLTHATLKKAGFRVIEAANGEMALEKMRQGLPDLVLMDVNMPVMDGFEAARRAREMPDAQGVPIVAYSAQAGDRVEERIRAAGFTARLTKPADVEELLATFAAVGMALPERGK